MTWLLETFIRIFLGDITKRDERVTSQIQLQLPVFSATYDGMLVMRSSQINSRNTVTYSVAGARSHSIMANLKLRQRRKNNNNDQHDVDVQG